MLNIFPALLNFSFFAPTILRAGVGILFGYIAYTQWRRREEISSISYPVVGSGSWIAWIAILWDSVVAAGILIGLYTQIAALLGALSALKFFLWGRRYPTVSVLSRPASFLLFMVCISLLIAGAGALAFDVPL